MSRLTTRPATPARPGADVPSDRRLAVRAFTGMLLRDLRVLTSERGRFIARTVSQPLLLVFVFTYVFPTIGQAVGDPEGGSFTQILVPGVLAITVLIKGVQAVALPLVQEFGYTREIEDRVMAPLPVWAVGCEKIAAGAAQGLVAAFIVAPIVAFVPAEPIDVQVSWPALVAVAVLAPIVASALGLVLGTYIEPNNVPLMFSLVILPITFLGATYFPWVALEEIRWLQIAVLLNPLVYMSEGFRLALTPQFPHMPGWIVVLALLVSAVGVSWVGVRGFQRRVVQ